METVHQVIHIIHTPPKVSTGENVNYFFFGKAVLYSVVGGGY